jgi:hypothetical protein
MSTQIILKVLALRHRLRQRDHWTRQRLQEYQGGALHRLREHAYARSPFYGRFHKGFTDRPLSKQPVLTSGWSWSTSASSLRTPPADSPTSKPTSLPSAAKTSSLAGATGWPPRLAARAQAGFLPLGPWRVGHRACLLQPLLRLGWCWGRSHPSHEDDGGELHPPWHQSSTAGPGA